MRHPEGFRLFRLGLLAASLGPAAAACLAGWAALGPVAGFASSAAFLLVVQAFAEVSFMAPWRGAVFLLVRVSYSLLRMAPAGWRRGLAAERMVVAVNNDLEEREAARAPAPSRILLLLPHCLQVHSCPVRLVHDVGGCRRCGGCDVSALLSLAEERGAAVAVATGGTLARKAVERVDPDLVMAVACPRDLCSGIMDSWPRRVWGQLNMLPNGECYDTRADVALLRRALDRLTGGAGGPARPV